MPYTGGPTDTIKVVQKSGASSASAEILDRFYQMLADTGVEEIKRILMSGILKHPSGALANSIQGRVEGSAVVWWADAEYASAQEYGVKPHQMWHLMGRTVPMTIYKYGGEIKVFRKVSLKSLLAGKWFHPGYPGKYFMKRGVEMALSRIPQLLERASSAVIQVGI